MKSLPKSSKESHKRQTVKRKILTYSGGILLLIGFLIVLGTAGASDLELVEFPLVELRLLSGVLIGGIGVLGLFLGDRCYEI